MTLLFVDTSAWLALVNERDKWHPAATQAYPSLLKTYDLVTTNHVLAETYELTRRRLGHAKVTFFVEKLHQSPRLQIVYTANDIELQAVALLRQYADQNFSYVDAVSFALMRAWEIHHAFTFDAHFLVMGFERLPHAGHGRVAS